MKHIFKINIYKHILKNLQKNIYIEHRRLSQTKRKRRQMKEQRQNDDGVNSGDSGNKKLI